MKTVMKLVNLTRLSTEQIQQRLGRNFTTHTETKHPGRTETGIEMGATGTGTDEGEALVEPLMIPTYHFKWTDDIEFKLMRRIKEYRRMGIIWVRESENLWNFFHQHDDGVCLNCTMAPCREGFNPKEPRYAFSFHPSSIYSSPY
jgi:hypothetical protein